MMTETMVKLSQENKRLQILYLFFIWFKAAEVNGATRSGAIQTLIQFMVADLHWQRKRAAQEILDFFRKTQQSTPDELITIWELLRE